MLSKLLPWRTYLELVENSFEGNKSEILKEIKIIRKMKYSEERTMRIQRVNHILGIKEETFQEALNPPLTTRSSHKMYKVRKEAKDKIKAEFEGLFKSDKCMRCKDSTKGSIKKTCLVDPRKEPTLENLHSLCEKCYDIAKFNKDYKSGKDKEKIIQYRIDMAELRGEEYTPPKWFTPKRKL